MGKHASFVLGTLFGAAAGVACGILIAPRAGVESRSMAADAVNDAWDSAMDSYERHSATVSGAASRVRSAVADRVNPMVDEHADELRAKVDAARERMDALRDSLSETVSAASTGVQDAARSVADQVSAMAGDAAAPAADAVVVEVVDADAEPAAEAGEAEE